ncbi:MAG: UDP-N-acetylmuramate dehydrogenase [Eggerthellaceae bacterium]|nr:UDP-N-acetylmuramate dehydrogenase [Eggerthellaceae bacterium]
MARHASPLQSLLVDDRFDGDVYPREPMARHTTYRIGGPARFFVRVGSVGALARLVEVCEEQGVPWVVVGRGSNLLVADEGFPGVVVSLGRDFRTLKVDEEAGRLYAGGGVMLSAVVQEAFQRSLAGFEFAVGTPGTVGGAIAMNAGARDEWIGERVVSVTTLAPGRGLERIPGDAVTWGYRSSSLPSDAVVVECELAAEKGDPFYIRGKMEANLSRRKRTQPLTEASCGSVFRNPEGASAAALIEGLGLKGANVGGARVSDAHANFIVNEGGATAADVRALIGRIQTEVRQAHGITLTPEVRFLGFE